MTYTGITYKDPEYRILEPIVDDDMCSVMMRMRLEKEFSAEELAKKCKKSVEYVQEQCDKLVAAGVICVLRALSAFDIAAGKEVAEIVLDIGELSLVIPKYVEDIYPVVVGGYMAQGHKACDKCHSRHG